MLQLATLSARGASEARDLLITRAVEQHLAPSSTLHRSCFGPAWRSPLQFAISTIGNSAGLIGAGYMIVNELALTRAGCGANPHPRWPCGPHPSSSRTRPVRGDPRLAETRGTSRTVYGILGERHTAECQEGISRDTQALMGGTRSSVMGKIIAVPAGQDKNSWLFDPQTSAACPRTSPDVQFSLRIRILHLGVFRWTNPNGGQNGGQTHSQTKQRGLVRSRLYL
jgi:hypothetical protein